MREKIIQNFLVPIFILVANSAHADSEIKLKCTIEGVVASQHGKDFFKKEIIVEVSKNGEDVAILTDDENVGSVSTFLKRLESRSSNYSDANKWSVSTINKTSYGILENNISIDRNTGMLVQFSIFKDVQTSTRGICTRVNTSKKLF